MAARKRLPKMNVLRLGIRMSLPAHQPPQRLAHRVVNIGLRGIPCIADDLARNDLAAVPYLLVSSPVSPFFQRGTAHDLRHVRKLQTGQPAIKVGERMCLEREALERLVVQFKSVLRNGHFETAVSRLYTAHLDCISLHVLRKSSFHVSLEVEPRIV